MGDLYVESYKKSVSNILDYWNKKLADYAKQLDPIDDKIAELNKNKSSPISKRSATTYESR